MKKRQDLAKQFLISILNTIEKEEIIEGFTYMWLEEIIEISYLNNFEKLMQGALNLRNSKEKHGNPLAGTITNIESVTLKTDYDWPKDKNTLKKKYSYNNVKDFLKMMEQSKESGLLIQNPKNVNKAIKIARNDADLEIIASYLCVNGHFDAAQKIIDNELSAFEDRIWAIKCVKCIELFRRNHFEKGKMILTEIYSEEPNNNWSKLFFARGILGYEPWGGYPFSDD